MPNQTRIVAPGPSDRTVRTGDGQILHASADWELLPPGDAGLTRRVKAAGPTWTVQEKKGRKTFSRGVRAPADRIAAVRAELEAERSTDAYAKRRAADVARRERKQTEYVEDFRGAVLAFLDFAPCYADLAEQLADAVTQHATQVGSGVVGQRWLLQYVLQRLQGPDLDLVVGGLVRHAVNLGRHPLLGRMLNSNST